MNWWYRKVFLDRNMPISDAAPQRQQAVVLASNSRWLQNLPTLFRRIAQRIKARLETRYDWKVCKNLSDHQLDDIGLTRDDLHKLIRRQTPLLAPSRVKVPAREKTVIVTEAMMNADQLKAASPVVGVCCNDSVDQVA